MHQSKEGWLQFYCEWGSCLAMWQWWYCISVSMIYAFQISISLKYAYINDKYISEPEENRDNRATELLQGPWCFLCGNSALDINPLLVLSEEKHIMPVFASNCFPVLSLANIEKIFSQMSVNGEDGFMLSSLVANVFSECLRKRWLGRLCQK